MGTKWYSLVGTIVRAGKLKSFQEIREEYAVPNQSFYRYLQVKHALDTQFGGGIRVE